MNETKFERGAWITLLLVIFFFLWGGGLMIYGFTLPTDGWYTQPPQELDVAGIVYVENLMGAPSGLQPGDIVVAINGIGGSEPDLSPLQSDWYVGNTMQYTVERDGTQLEVAVPLVQWQIVPALSYWFFQGGDLTLVGMLVFVAIAALAFFKRPNDHAARALLFYAALFPALTPLIEVSQASPPFLVYPGLSLLTGITTFTAYSILFPPALLRLALVFPQPKPIVRRHPFVEYLPFPLGLLVIPFFLTGVYIAGYLWTLSSILGAILILIHSAFTMRDALSRAQLMWGLWGLILGMLMFSTTYLGTFGIVTGTGLEITNALTGLSFSVIGITLGIAILRYRLFDIDIIIRRTLTYVIVTALLVVVFFGSVILLQQLFATFANPGSNDFITVISTLVIAALFVPLRNRVQGVIDRRFNRKKYNAQQVLQEFSETVRDETDLETLTGRLVEVVNETMQPKTVTLWLKKE